MQKRATRKRQSLGFNKEITAIQFIGLEDRLVVSVGDKRVTSRKTDGGNGPDFSGVSDFMYSVRCSADGMTVVAGGQDGVLRIWDKNGKSIAAFSSEPTESKRKNAG